MKFNLLLLLVLVLASCNVNKSYKKDLNSGLESTGDGLSCEDVLVTHSEMSIENNTFIYGEALHFDFDNFEGLTEVNGKVYPGMSMVVLDQSGDSVLYESDLYASYKDGFALNKLSLLADLTLANPIFSGAAYRTEIRIWDKKGKGSFQTKLAFKLQADPKLKIEDSGLKFKEMYLFSKEKTVCDGKIASNEAVYLFVEGLDGFVDEEGMVFPGAMARITDENGKVIVQEDDIFSMLNETGAPLADLQEQLRVSFTLTNARPGAKFNVYVKIWDKIGGEELNVKTVCEIE